VTTATVPHVRLRRAYEDAGAEDGDRVLVDRVWPRGRTKSQLKLDAWRRELAPTAELRKWFGHDPRRWAEFQKRYHAELAAPDLSKALDELAAVARTGALTLVYGARDTQHNQARVIADEIESRLGGDPLEAR
jgi:uncharacterized protein YeaO (DUF488 family)